MLLASGLAHLARVRNRLDRICSETGDRDLSRLIRWIATNGF